MRRTPLLLAVACVLAVAAAPTKAADTRGYDGHSIQPEDLTPKAETNIAVNPRDPRQVVVTAIRFGSQYKDYYVKGASVEDHIWTSRDGGRRFSHAGSLPGLDPARPAANDPTLAWGQDGTLWASYTAFGPNSTVSDPREGLYAAVSTDNGRHWRRTARIEGFRCDGPDRSTVAVDPVRGWAYVAWVHYVETDCSVKPSVIDDTKTTIRWSRTKDGGRTWSRPVIAAPMAAAAHITPTVLRDGTLVVSYIDKSRGDGFAAECGSTASSLAVARWDVSGQFLDRGRPVPVLCDAGGLSPNGSAHIVIRQPAVAADPRTGRVAIATAYTSATKQGAVVASSGDGGRTWASTVVTGLPGSTATMPALAAGPRGTFALAYLELDAGGFYRPVLASSSDGGTTFTAPVSLVDVPSVGNARPRTAFDPYNIGHYMGVAVGGDGIAHVAWPDLRPRGDAPADVDVWVRGVPLW